MIRDWKFVSIIMWAHDKRNTYQSKTIGTQQAYSSEFITFIKNQAFLKQFFKLDPLLANLYLFLFPSRDVTTSTCLPSRFLSKHFPASRHNSRNLHTLVRLGNVVPDPSSMIFSVCEAGRRGGGELGEKVWLRGRLRIFIVEGFRQRHANNSDN